MAESAFRRDLNALLRLERLVARLSDRMYGEDRGTVDELNEKLRQSHDAKLAFLATYEPRESKGPVACCGLCKPRILEHVVKIDGEDNDTG